MRRFAPLVVLLVLVAAGCGESSAEKNAKALRADQQAIGTSPGEAEAEQQIATERAEEERNTHREEAREQHREAAEEAEINRLLRDRHAVGLSTTAVKRLLGPPYHTQDIAGQVFWYYKQGDETEYQLVISSGVVGSINRY